MKADKDAKLRVACGEGLWSEFFHIKKEKNNNNNGVTVASSFRLLNVKWFCFFFF